MMDGMEDLKDLNSRVVFLNGSLKEKILLETL